MKKCILFLLLCSGTYTMQAQVLMNLDSLLKLESKAVDNTAAIDLYINIGQQYENNDLPKAKYYYQKAGKLGEKLNDIPGIIKFIHNYTYTLNLEGKFDSSLVLNLRAVELSRQTNDTVNLSKAFFNTGSVYRYTGNFQKAILYYTEGQKLMEKSGNLRLSAQLNDLLQVLYADLKQYDKAIEYGKKSVEYFRKSGELNLLGVALNNLALCYNSKNDISEALKFYKEILQIGLKINDLNMQGTAYLNMGDAYMKLGNYLPIEKYYRNAYQIFTKLDTPEGIVVALRGLSLHASYMKNFKDAERFARESVEKAARHKLKLQQQKSLVTLGNVYYALHDMSKAEKIFLQSQIIADSLFNESLQEKVLDIESKYKTSEKNNQIKQLEDEKQIQKLSNKTNLLIIQSLIGIILTFLIVGYLLMRNNRQKNKLQEQKIKNLEAEKLVEATEAVLKGEERERRRLAKDLHDGLGGMLSGIKYSFQNIKGNLLLTPDNAQVFERSLDMLDSSIKEMRRVAHDLMPENLLKFGLDMALKDYCSSINTSDVLQVNYQSFGMENEKLDQRIAVTAYRIIQELLNNTIKHANATQALVQLTKSNGMLLIDVEDNGIGFDPTILENQKGIGWKNIQNRLEYINGNLDLKSKKGKGTSVHIEIILNEN